MLTRLVWSAWLLWLADNGVRTLANRRRRDHAGTPKIVQEPPPGRQQHLAACAVAALLLLPWPPLGPLDRRWLPARSRWQTPGLVLELLGLGLATWARATLRQHWTGRVALTTDQPLITSGPYRLVRHPLYTGILAAALGAAVVQGQVRGLAGITLLVATYRRKVGYEEPALHERFGSQYAAYAAAVPAFIPRLPAEQTSEMSVDVYGDIEWLWQFASDVSRWAEFLPHYRYVTVLADNDGQRTVEMAARRGVIPIAWTSTLALDPSERRIRFEHIGGKARGMLVEWRIVQHDGFVRATIWHDLRHLQLPFVASRFGRYVLADQFIEPIAGRTLGCMKALVEGHERAD
jgi:protein-S-isoprenylcysteine O-methyltransferase Ste14/ribosome-associated toxin RatA of RatAB toxin-antitoxin module